MTGFHPIHNLAGVAPNSMFVMGRKDPFVPSQRRGALQRAIELHLPSAKIVKLDAGHFRTLLLSARHQLRPDGTGAGAIALAGAHAANCRS